MKWLKLLLTLRGEDVLAGIRWEKTTSWVGGWDNTLRLRLTQWVKKRGRRSWLTNNALVYEPKCGGGVLRVSANEYSCAQWSPNKLLRSISIFNLWSNHSFATSVYLFVGVCKAMLETLTIARQDVGLGYRMSTVCENLFNALIQELGVVLHTYVGKFIFLSE